MAFGSSSFWFRTRRDARRCHDGSHLSLSPRLGSDLIISNASPYELGLMPFKFGFAEAGAEVDHI